MKKTIIIILVFTLLSINVIPSYASSTDNSGKITFQLNLPTSITDDIYLKLLNIDTEETIALHLLYSNGYKAEKELEYGNYEVINIDMVNINKYEISFGGPFGITKYGFDLKMSIRENPPEIKTGWLNIKAIIPFNHQDGISFVLQSEEFSQTHRLSQGSNYSAKIELPHGEYTLGNIKLQASKENEYAIEYIENITISEKEVENIIIIQEIEQQNTNTPNPIEDTQQQPLEPAQDTQQQPSEPTQDTQQSEPKLNADILKLIIITLVFIVIIIAMVILYRKIVGQ